MSPPEAVAKQRAIVGGEADPFAYEWSLIDKLERQFWCRAARQDIWLSEKPWKDIPGEARCRIKNGLYRAAQRASVLLASSAPMKAAK